MRNGAAMRCQHVDGGSNIQCRFDATRRFFVTVAV
jgi:hypothetical protein